MAIHCQYAHSSGLSSYLILPLSFVGSQQAAQDKLAFVNGAGNAIMKVDNTSKVDFNDKRNSIRISSKDRYTVNSLWIADILHLPYGVSLAHTCSNEACLTPHCI